MCKSCHAVIKLNVMKNCFKEIFIRHHSHVGLKFTMKIDYDEKQNLIQSDEHDRTVSGMSRELNLRIRQISSPEKNHDHHKRN